MTPEEALGVADQVLYVHAGKRLTDIQRLILLESLAGKGYEEMQGYATQHIKNEGKELWAALSGALDEKVSKTNFRGALEKCLRSTQIVPKPPSLSAYDAETWAGRDALIDDLLNQLHGQTRLLCLTGISGIGKTALAECLAVQFQNLDVSFHRVSFDIVGQSQDFTAGAAEILAELGDKDLDPKELNDPKRLSDRLLRKLQMHQYWLQLDALERLLDPEHPTEFTDSHWLGFFQRCLSSSNFLSRLVLTAQAIPSEFARFEDDYPHAWGEQTLRGLSEAEQLELFGKYGVTDDSTNDALLSRIGRTYEGHPLVLRVIGGEIRKDFGGKVAQYWERYGSEFEQVGRELQSQRVNPALYNQTLQRRVRQRVEISLKRLPEDALALLCRSAVYRRPVVESFWLVMLNDRTSFEQQEAYQILSDRALVEQEDIHQGQLFIRQHNLIRDVSYDLLKQNIEAWEIAERKAAEVWLMQYEPALDAPNFEKVRGYLESFHHCCQISDWEAASAILLTNLDNPTRIQLHKQLVMWSYYSDAIHLCQMLLGKLDVQTESIYLNTLGIAYRLSGDYNRAIAYQQKHLAIARKLTDRQKEMAALGNLGISYQALGNSTQAIECYTAVLMTCRELGDSKGEGATLNNIAIVYMDLGKYQQACDYLQQSLAIAQRISDRIGESKSLGNLGSVHINMGNFRQAIEYTQKYLEIARELNDRWEEGNALNSLGISYCNLNNYHQAIEYHQQALVVNREIGSQSSEARALAGLADAFSKIGRYLEACEYFQASLNIFQKTGERFYEADVLLSLATLHQEIEEDSLARQYCDQALIIANELGIPLAEKCRELKEELERSAE